MTATAPQQILDRFVEADALLRKAQEQLAGLTAARASAEASADQLARAAAAVAAFSSVARAAADQTTRVQEQVASALDDLQKLGASFDNVKLLAAVEEVRVQVGELRQQTAAQGERLDVVERAVESLPGSLDASGRRVIKQITTGRAETATALEQLRNEVVDEADAALDRDARLIARLDAMAALIGELTAKKVQDEEAITGIVDVLPRRSRRKLGL